MARRRRKLTRRESTFAWIGFTVVLLIYLGAILATNFSFTRFLGPVGILFAAWAAILVSILGRLFGVALARATNPVITARKVPKNDQDLGSAESAGAEMPAPGPAGSDMVCPNCGQRYPAGVTRFCLKDDTELEPT